MTEVEYKISIYPSKFLGYQSKARNKGEVKVYVSTLLKYAENDFWKFVHWLDAITLIERLCLERGFQKIKMKDRCKRYKDSFGCKMEWVAYQMFKSY